VEGKRGWVILSIVAPGVGIWLIFGMSLGLQTIRIIFATIRLKKQFFV
jgi:hypothetical protein